MAEISKLQASPREITGKKVRFLRREGVIPANLYGKNEPSTAIQIDNHELELFLRSHPRSQVLNVVIDGHEDSALVSHVQRHPTKRSLLHVDFHRISLDVAIQVPVQLEFVGEAPAIRVHEGMILHALTEVLVEGLPTAIPESIEVDVSSLEEIDASIYVRDLTAPSGTSIVTDPDELVTKVLPPTVEPEEAEAEGEAVAEGEAAEGAEAAAEGEGPEAAASDDEKKEES